MKIKNIIKKAKRQAIRDYESYADTMLSVGNSTPSIDDYIAHIKEIIDNLTEQLKTSKNIRIAKNNIEMYKAELEAIQLVIEDSALSFPLIVDVLINKALQYKKLSDITVWQYEDLMKEVKKLPNKEQTYFFNKTGFIV